MKLKFIILALIVGFFVVGWSVKTYAVTETVVDEAGTHLGVPYVFGGTSPTEGFDSSGFVQYVFSQAASVQLPRTVRQQWETGVEVERDQLQEADIVFFSRDRDGVVTHNGIYIGNNQMITVSVSQGVSIASISTGYWGDRYTGARRATQIRPDDHPLVNEAIRHLGVPYVFGGTTTDGFDCSGFIRYVFRETLGIYLPRSTYQQWEFGEEIALDDIQAGDVIYFENTYRPGISHAGIYMGNGQFIHAADDRGVTTDFVTGLYWTEKIAGVRRFTQPNGSTVVEEAKKHLGAPYQSGGDTPDGFDASGFLQYIYRESEGVYLPRSIGQQWQLGEEVAEPALTPGDILFFSRDLDGVPTHTGIYLGYNQFIHASFTYGVSVTSLDEAYWGPRYIGARRYENLDLEVGAPTTNRIVEEAKNYIGVPYSSGGNNPDQGFDSSGFIQFIINTYGEGIYFPRTAASQWGLGESISRDNLQPGDLLFFSNDNETITHVSMYIGDDQMIHSTISQGVSVAYFENSSYWNPKFVGAKRINTTFEVDSPIVNEALNHLGKPYLTGGTGPDGFDSSGFIQYVVKESVNIDLPRTLAEQRQRGEEVNRSLIKQGDIVFFSANMDGNITHAGIYAGNFQFIHVSVSQGVTISSLNDSYWGPRFSVAIRIL
ncbi:MAG: NlpC/P60 family protein [Dehalobacterium sp.]